jgi:predicted transcriptional regulator
METSIIKNNISEFTGLSRKSLSSNKKYTAIVKNDEYRVKANHTFLEKVNGNSVKNFVASLYDGNVLSKEDLKELEEFINEKLKSDN